MQARNKMTRFYEQARETKQDIVELIYQSLDEKLLDFADIFQDARFIEDRYLLLDVYLLCLERNKGYAIDDLSKMLYSIIPVDEKQNFFYKILDQYSSRSNVIS